MLSTAAKSEPDKKRAATIIVQQLGLTSDLFRVGHTKVGPLRPDGAIESVPMFRECQSLWVRLLNVPATC